MKYVLQCFILFYFNSYIFLLKYGMYENTNYEQLKIRWEQVHNQLTDTRLCSLIRCVSAGSVNKFASSDTLKRKPQYTAQWMQYARNGQHWILYSVKSHFPYILMSPPKETVFLLAFKTLGFSRRIAAYFLQNCNLSTSHCRIITDLTELAEITAINYHDIVFLVCYWTHCLSR